MTTNPDVPYLDAEGRLATPSVLAQLDARTDTRMRNQLPTLADELGIGGPLTPEDEAAINAAADRAESAADRAESAADRAESAEPPGTGTGTVDDSQMLADYLAARG